MKPEELYIHLKELSEKLGVTVAEHSFRQTGIKAKSGLCKIKGEQMFIVNKHLSVYQKNNQLLACLKKMPYKNIYVLPAIRERLEKGK
ncbi:hypothetical protein QUF75_18185 [Desulfococcaceae bacterium HSG7]|nr:hypothetical protein [Desulfococcaceae bacterium HSG7]